jgi:hypothetical protein
MTLVLSPFLFFVSCLITVCKVLSFVVIIIICLFHSPPLGDIQILFLGIGNFQIVRTMSRVREEAGSGEPLARGEGMWLSTKLLVRSVGVLGPIAHPGLPLEVFLGVGRCRRL